METSCQLGFPLEDSIKSIMGLMSGSPNCSFLTSSSLHGSGSDDVDVTWRMTGLINPYVVSTLRQCRQLSGQGRLDRASAFPCDDPFR